MSGHERLRKQWKYFERQRNSLAEKHHGKFVIICNEQIHAFEDVGWLDVQVKVKTFPFADVPEKPHEGSVAFPFNPNQDNAPAANPTRAHPVSTEPREPTEHAPPILRIEADIAPQPPHILNTVEPGGPGAVLLEDEDLFLLQIVRAARRDGEDTSSWALRGLLSRDRNQLRISASMSTCRSPSISSRIASPVTSSAYLIMGSRWSRRRVPLDSKSRRMGASSPLWLNRMSLSPNPSTTSMPSIPRSLR